MPPLGSGADSWSTTRTPLRGGFRDMTMIDAPALRLRGRVVRSGDADWDTARQAFNLTVDQRPAAIAFPLDASDVATAVDYAREAGLRVAPQRTGHNAAPLGALEDVLLVRTDALQGVEIDAKQRRARVNAGAKWE